MLSSGTTPSVSARSEVISPLAARSTANGNLSASNITHQTENAEAGPSKEDVPSIGNTSTMGASANSDMEEDDDDDDLFAPVQIQSRSSGTANAGNKSTRGTSASNGSGSTGATGDSAQLNLLANAALDEPQEPNTRRGARKRKATDLADPDENGEIESDDSTEQSRRGQGGK